MDEENTCKTGGAGFIGSNFIRVLLHETLHEVVNLDTLTINFQESQRKIPKT